jgi:dolichol-phosphate mannosyltransferase
MTLPDLSIAYARSTAPRLALVHPTEPPREAFAAERSGTVEWPFVPVELSVIVPTFNERGNLDELVRRVGAALPGVRWEMIIVDDDSPDRTADYARALHARDGRIRVIRRIGRRGLASACVEGMLASSAPYLAVIDADLQHDPALLADMLETLRGGATDLIAASRYIPGASIGDWDASRAATSRVATWLARTVTAIDLSDPMSGFFALRREVIDRWAPDLSAIGFKVLLDIVLTAGPGLRVREVPLRFALRHQGESKLSPRVAWDYAMMLADKLFGRVIPVRLFAFACVGTIGVVVHLAALAILLGAFQLAFAPAQAISAGVAMTANYAINNLLTYADRCRRGWAWFSGLASFVAICSIGAAANVFIAAAAYNWGLSWLGSALVGIAVAMLWNYGASARHTWSANG